MANAFKCDRCGKYYDQYRGITYKDENRSFLCDSVAIGAGKTYTKEFDLCMDCFNHLINWLSCKIQLDSLNKDDSLPTYGDIFKEAIETYPYLNPKDWRPYKGLSIKIWTLPGHTYIYSHEGKSLNFCEEGDDE